MPTFIGSFLAPTPSPGNSLCPLWLFSVLSVLNSEKLNTEVTKNHREIGLELLITTRASGANLSPRFGGCRGPSSLRRVPRRLRERLLRPGSGSRLSQWPSRAFLDRLI